MEMNFESWNETTSLPDGDELKKIRKSLNQRNWKIVLTSLVLAIVLLLVGVYMIVPAVESLYWAPYTSDYIENGNDLKLMLEAHTELFHPGKKIQSVNAGDAGFASYDLSITRTDTATKDKEYISGTLVRNTLELDYLFYDYSTERAFFSGNNSLPPEFLTHYREESTERLSGLPEYVTVKALAFFPEDLTMEQIQKLLFKYNYDSRNGVDFQWIGVRNAAKDAENSLLSCGFSTDPGGYLEELNAFYPELCRLTAKEDGSHLTEHFKSLLRFSADQLDKGRGLPIGTLHGNFYRDVLDYVEENDVMSYGCLVTGTPQGLQSMLDDGTASTLILLDGWIDVD